MTQARLIRWKHDVGESVGKLANQTLSSWILIKRLSGDGYQATTTLLVYLRLICQHRRGGRCQTTPEIYLIKPQLEVMEIFLKQIIKQVKRSNEKVCKEMFAYRPLVANKRHLRTQIWSFTQNKPHMTAVIV